MSVLKSKRTESKAEYVNVANAIYIETINFLTRISARYSRLIAEPVAKLAGEVIDHAEKANSIYPSDDQRRQLRKAHLLEARASLMALDVRLTHCYLIMTQNPQGCFTTPSGKSVDAKKATERLDKMAQKLGELIDKENDLLQGMIYDNGASRIGKGLHWQIKRIKQQLARHYRKYGRAGGVLLLDLKKFFPYAPHSIIYQRHQRYILNPDFRRIADTIIDTAPGEFPGRGMPLGVEPSQQEMAAMPSAVDNWIKCQMSTHSAGHYMDDYCIILPDIEDLKKLGRAIVRQFEIRGIPVNKKKCKIIPLTKPFRWCKARFTLTETGKIKVNGSRDGVIRARRKLKLFHREWLAGKRTLQEVAQYMNCQEAYYKNFDDHGRLLRLRRLCYAIFGGKVPCSKSSKPVMAPSLP